MTSPAPSTPDAPPRSSLRADLLTAYLASGSKVASWAIVSAILYRTSQEGFALFAFVRGTLGLLNYSALGIAPAMLRLIATETARAARHRVSPIIPARTVEVIDYARPAPIDQSPETIAYSNGFVIAVISAVVATTLVVFFAHTIHHWYQFNSRLLAESASAMVIMIGLGIIFRLLSDLPATLIQSSGRIARDNLFLVTSELIWVTHVVGLYVNRREGFEAAHAAFAFLIAGVILFFLRVFACGRLFPDFRLVCWSIVSMLARFGVLVTVAQVADFLYGPTDLFLITYLIGPESVIQYAPLLQIDAGLLLLVTGIASVLLPRAAHAHAGDDHALLKTYYLRGTLGSASILALTATLIWLLSPWIFKLWLGSDAPGSRALLPLVLIHTVVGGSSAVGRSILLGMGKVKPFTVSVLIAGASNVILSYVFVRYLELGLKGIVYGTIVAVVGRCAVWMPWYVLRTLRRERSLAETTLQIPEDLPPNPV